MTDPEKLKEYRKALKSTQDRFTTNLAIQHRDLLIDAILYYFHTLKTPNDILLQTQKGTSSLARFVLYVLMREAGFTLATIAVALNRNPATVTLGILHFLNEIIDKPTNPEYTNAYMGKYAEIPKPALIEALIQLRTFNEELLNHGQRSDQEIGLSDSEQQKSQEI